jgi:SAM-dependent methyltransferase
VSVGTRLRRVRSAIGRGIDARPPGIRGRRSRDAGDGRTAATAADPNLWLLLEPYIPDDHARQVNASYYVERLMTGPDPAARVLDLGCGRGDSVDLFRRFRPDVDWVGADVAVSFEVSQRRRADATFVTYDGERLPFAGRSFDLVYSRQVLEHVPDPAGHLREVARVLRPGGAFIGSTSQLEPYHSMSYWNFTPVGFVALAHRAGLAVRELRPGIDGVTLPLRTYFGRPPEFNTWWDEASPLNQLIDEWGRDTGRRPALVNLRKLEVCGQFAFHVVKEARRR